MQYLTQELQLTFCRILQYFVEIYDCLQTLLVTLKHKSIGNSYDI